MAGEFWPGFAAAAGGRAQPGSGRRACSETMATAPASRRPTGPRCTTRRCSHLARYAATEAGLVRVLDRRIARWARAAGADRGGGRGAVRRPARWRGRWRGRARWTTPPLPRRGRAGCCGRAGRAGRWRRIWRPRASAPRWRPRRCRTRRPSSGGARLLLRRRRHRAVPRGGRPTRGRRRRELGVLARAGFPARRRRAGAAHGPGRGRDAAARAQAGLMSLDAPAVLARSGRGGDAGRACRCRSASVPFGLVVGIFAQGQGLSLAEITLMSALCYAGSAQLLALGHWGVPAPVVAAATGGVRRQSAAGADGAGDRRLGSTGSAAGGCGRSLFLMADQNWAMSVAEMQAGRWDAGFLFGIGRADVGGLGGVHRGRASGRLRRCGRRRVTRSSLRRWRCSWRSWCRCGAAGAICCPGSWRRGGGAAVARVLPGTSWHIVGRRAGRQRGGRAAGPAGVRLDPWVLLAILAMSLATYATRAGGYLMFRAFRPTPGVRVMLSYIPGTLFVAYVAPALADGRLPEWVGAAATLSLMLATPQSGGGGPGRDGGGVGGLGLGEYANPRIRNALRLAGNLMLRATLLLFRLLLSTLLLAACAGGGSGRYGTSVECAPYARQVTGIRLYGDAADWWDAAEGHYARGAAPVAGRRCWSSAAPAGCLRATSRSCARSRLAARDQSRPGELGPSPRHAGRTGDRRLRRQRLEHGAGVVGPGERDGRDRLCNAMVSSRP